MTQFLEYQLAQRLRITGIVQGVGYRAALCRRAQSLQLSGWVRNRLDGSVEAIVSGAADALADIVAWARRGPQGAQVREVLIEEIDDSEATGVTDLARGRFDILPTV
jgi:acylphosphatase